jgi:hypothetical protein
VTAASFWKGSNVFEGFHRFRQVETSSRLLICSSRSSFFSVFDLFTSGNVTSGNGPFPQPFPKHIRKSTCVAMLLPRLSSHSALRALGCRQAPGGLRRAPAPQPPPGTRCMAAGSPEQVTVSEDSSSSSATGGGGEVIRYSHTMHAGRHALRGDLMPQAGGGDAGPSPKELAMLSLGQVRSLLPLLSVGRGGGVKISVPNFTLSYDPSRTSSLLNFSSSMRFLSPHPR